MHRTLAFVLEQSALGHHHLFDPELLRRAFVDAAAPAPEGDGSASPSAIGDARWIEPHEAEVASALIEGLREQPDLGRQRRWIEAAPEPVQRVFVRLYFEALTGFMAERGVSYH